MDSGVTAPLFMKKLVKSAVGETSRCGIAALLLWYPVIIGRSQMVEWRLPLGFHGSHVRRSAGGFAR